MTFTEWVNNCYRDQEYYIMLSITNENLNKIKPIGVDVKIKSVVDQDKFDSIAKSYTIFVDTYYKNREKISRGWIA